MWALPLPLWGPMPLYPSSGMDLLKSMLVGSVLAVWLFSQLSATTPARYVGITIAVMGAYALIPIIRNGSITIYAGRECAGRLAFFAAFGNNPCPVCGNYHCRYGGLCPYTHHQEWIYYNLCW